MMKILLLTILFTISCYSYAEVNTNVYNNYIALSEPEYAPHSKLIKRQEISFDKDFIYKVFTHENYGKKIIIESNENGLINFIDRGNGDISSYDYDKKVNINKSSLNKNNNNCYITINENNDIEYISTFDEFNLLINIIDSSFPTLEPLIDDMDLNYCHWREYFYENDKIVKYRVKTMDSYTGTDIFYPEKNEKTTEDRNLVESINLTNYKDYSEESFLIRKIQYIYDSSHGNKLIRKYANDYSIGPKLFLTCDFSEHNKHGDWTKGRCFFSSEVRIIDFIIHITRKLEYWE